MSVGILRFGQDDTVVHVGLSIVDAGAEAKAKALLLGL